MLKHFVLTRIGIGQYAQRWFDSALDLFEAVTLSSLRNQTNQQFEWLVTVDVDMPRAAHDRVRDLLSPYPNFHLIPIDVAHLQRMRHGCFDWAFDACQDYILGRGLVTDPSEYVITSIIDSDDGWHREVAATIKDEMEQHRPTLSTEEASRTYHIRHTSGIAATFPLGLRWFPTANCAEPLKYPFMSNAVFVLSRFSSGISASSSRH
jgi:hypothetical protein